MNHQSHNWSCPKKIAARNATIIEAFRELFSTSVPADRQYWSLCGQCSNENHTLRDECELDQVLKSNLITPNQFYGVDIDPNIIEANSKAFPAAHFYCGSFYDVIREHTAKDVLNPAIVNADFTNMPTKACRYFSDILRVLSYCNGDMMVICNLILEHQNVKKIKSNIEIAMSLLNNDDNFQHALSIADWQRKDMYYRYDGTGHRSATIMGSLIFYKKGEAK